MGWLLQNPFIAQTLKTIIGKGAPFGSTPTGADWCVKALHPSDPLTEVRGIPDHSAIPTVCLNYQSVFTLGFNSATPGPWAFDMTLLPHPLYFAYWNAPKARCPETDISQLGNFHNTQLIPGAGNPDHVALYNAWRGLALRWRLAYQSVTIYQDGPDLANQGTIVVAQAPMSPLVSCVSAPPTSTLPIRSSIRAAHFPYSIMGPDFSRSQAMPNAMMGRSREGAYVPLKLTETCQDWYSQENDITPMSMDWEEPSTAWHNVPTVRVLQFPFENVTPISVNTSTLAVQGQAVPALISGNVAHISARNLAETTSYAFHFRVGIECQLAPSSSMTPQLKLSPPYDPMALDTYFRISRELKDAYPADYNDFGKMWEVISAAVKQLSPALNSMLPGLGSAGSAVALLGDSIAARRRQRRKPRGAPQMQAVKLNPTTLSAGNVETIRQQQTQARATRSAPATARSAGQTPPRRGKKAAFKVVTVDGQPGLIPI